MATENNNKTLNVPNLRFPEFSGEWERCTLGDVTTNFSRRNKEEIRYPMFSVTNNRGFVPQSEQFEDREMVGEDIKAYKIIHKNDFAYNPARINVGSIAKYNGDEPCMISSLYVCFTADKRIDNEWLMQLLKTPKMNFYYNINGEGGVRVYLFYPNFARIRTAFPSEEEQKKISAFLSLLDERIATQIKIIEKLESLIKGLTDDVFCCNGNIPMVRFSNLYKDAGEGGTPSTSTLEYYEGGTIPFVKIDDLTAKYLVAHKDCITEQGMQKSSAWLIPPGSVIYSNGATIGSISINTYPICTKQGILGIIPKDNVNVEYLYYLMTSVYFRKEIHRIITEGTMKTAYLKDINNILCPIPDIDSQKLIANKLASITEKIELEQQVLSLLQAQKKYLLSNLFI